jgi:hypothetical protein
MEESIRKTNSSFSNALGLEVAILGFAADAQSRSAAVTA